MKPTPYPAVTIGGHSSRQARSMKRAPAPAAIHEAELRFAQSSRNVRDGLGQIRLAISTNLARTSTLVKVAGVAALFCFWLGRRTRSRPAHPLGNAAATSVLGLIMAFVMRHGMNRLGTILR